MRTICIKADSVQAVMIKCCNKIQTTATKTDETYSSESWRCWKSCHDRVVRGFLDKFLLREKKQRYCYIELFHVNCLKSVMSVLFFPTSSFDVLFQKNNGKALFEVILTFYLLLRYIFTHFLNIFSFVSLLLLFI